MEKIFDKIIKGNAVLITGSGANDGIKTLENEKFPMGTGLAKCLYEECGIDQPDNIYDLQDASETFAEKYGDLQLISVIKKRLQVGNIGEVAPRLYKMPWMRCYTTNYDNVPMIASSDCKSIVPVTLKADVRKYREQKDLCVYINGHIDRLNEDTLNSEFKLTGKSYLSEETLFRSQWGEVFKEDLDLASVVIIVGLSLDYDLDIKRFIYNNSIRDKIIFVEKEGITDNKKRKLNRLGKVYDIGIQQFALDLGEYYKENHNLVQNEMPALYSIFDKNGYQRCDSKPHSRDIYAFLMNGTFTNKLFYKSKGKYLGLIYRDEVRKIVNGIEENKRVVFLHANLGNGKTTILHMVVQELYRRSINSFWFQTDCNGRLSEEISNIASESGRKVIIIEDYFNHIDLIKKIYLSGAKNISFILTSRTVLYESALGDVTNILNTCPGESIIVDANLLDDKEIHQCVKLFDSNEFWGKNTSLSTGQKRKLLTQRNKGNSQIQGILVGVVKSSDMNDRLKSIVNDIKKVSDLYFDTLILMLISQVMSLDMTIDDVNLIMNQNIVFDLDYQRNEAVQELIDFTGNKMRYKIKSSVVALMIIQELKCEEVIIEVLKRTAVYANQYSQTTKYENLLKNIMSYAHISSFIKKKKDSREFMINYYDSLKEIEYNKDNAFFWLQYSIACLWESEYELAQNYVDVAYEKFRENEYNVPFQINSQQASILYY